MTELKTLKNLRCDACDRDGNKKLSNFPRPVSVDIIELKQEAIKWVKWIKEKKNFEVGRTPTDFIMHFFNLTEEDLK